MTLTIPYPALRAMVVELRRHPYHVAVGDTGMAVLPTEENEILVRSVRYVHEGALRSRQEGRMPRFELGFVPFTLNRPDVWQSVALAARIEGELTAVPTCSVLLGSGPDVGLFTGIFSVGDKILPVREMAIPGAGMRRLAAVDFQSLRHQPVSSQDADRWSRLIGALGGQDVWEWLASLTFCIVGVGRTGSLVASTLSRQGVRKLSLIDPDILERHNLDAMDAVGEADLGRFKAQALATNLTCAFPRSQVVPLAQSAVTVAARSLAKSADVLICCVDDDVVRLAAGALACCYLKPLLDIGTGVFSTQARGPGARQLGADIRLVLPGDGCLLCWGGVAHSQEAFGRWRTGPSTRRRWDEERAGSLRSLNSVAAHAGIRLLEDLVAGRLAQSVWLRYETDERGMQSLRHLPATRRPNCPLCALSGIGDLFRQQPIIPALPCQTHAASLR